MSIAQAYRPTTSLSRISDVEVRFEEERPSVASCGGSHADAIEELSPPELCSVKGCSNLGYYECSWRNHFLRCKRRGGCSGLHCKPHRAACTDAWSSCADLRRPEACVDCEQEAVQDWRRDVCSQYAAYLLAGLLMVFLVTTPILMVAARSMSKH